jgi:polyisoprenoid-binding protein YceI
MKTTVFLVLGLTAAVAGVSAQRTTESYRVTDGHVDVACTLTTGGGFEARTTTVGGGLNPVDGWRAFSGAVQVDLATLETGIGLRNTHMKEIYLETSRGATYATARVDNIRIDRAEGHGPFDAMLTLHGEQHPISGVVDLQTRRDGAVSVRARFPVSLAAFDIRPPRYLGVGVEDEVHVQVTFVVVPGGDETRKGER